MKNKFQFFNKKLNHFKQFYNKYKIKYFLFYKEITEIN